MYLSWGAVSTRPCRGSSRAGGSFGPLTRVAIGGLLATLGLLRPVPVMAAPPAPVGLLPRVSLRTSVSEQVFETGRGRVHGRVTVQLTWELPGPRRPLVRWRDVSRSPLLADTDGAFVGEVPWLVDDGLTIPGPPLLADPTPEGSP